MLTEICGSIKNYFAKDEDKYIGEFSIVNGRIVPEIELPTDYFRIVGSRKNDGVHCLTDEGDTLIDEGKFKGAVWIMSPPKAFLDLAAEIEAWQAKNGGAEGEAMSPFNSESFGGYSYSKSGGGTGTGAVTGWQAAYASRLNMWRKIRA